MELWKLVLDEAAFQFFNGIRPVERRHLIHTFEQLKHHPRPGHEFGIKDITGRSLSRHAARPFLITYWLDELVREIRVVDMQRVRY